MTQKIKIGMIIMFSMISMFSFLSSFHSIPVKAATSSKETTSSKIKNDKQESKVDVTTDENSKEVSKHDSANTEKKTQAKSTNKLDNHPVLKYIIGIFGVIFLFMIIFGVNKSDGCGMLSVGIVMMIILLKITSILMN